MQSQIDLSKLIVKLAPPSPPVPPSEFEKGVAGELRALADQIDAGSMHIQHFSLTCSDEKQRMEIEVS